jgi:hypothetical protein
MGTIPDKLYKVTGSPKEGSYRWPVPRVVTGTNPAANTECSDTVPAGKCWLLRSYALTCVQGLTQTPLTSLTVTDTSSTVVYSYPGTSSAQNASVTLAMRWAPGLSLSAGGAATSATAPIADDMILPEGYSLVTSTAGKGANTDHGAPTIYVYEYSFAG